MVRLLYIFIFICTFLINVTYAAGVSGLTINEDKNLIDFAGKIEASIENRDPNYFNLSFDTEALLDEILNKKCQETDSAFKKGFVDGIKMSFDLGTIIINELSTNGSFKFIHAVERNNSTWLVFRLISEEGINYHEYKIEPDGGNFKITDGYFYLSGDKLSESIYQIYTRYANLLLRFKTDDNTFLKADSELRKIKIFYSEGKFQKAYKHWNKIPVAYQSEKEFQCARINIAAGLDHEVYLGIFKEYMATYPAEPGKYLIPLDGLIAQGYYDLALQCLDSLDTVLSTDPLLDYFRASICYDRNDLALAIDCLVRLINSMPDFEMGYLSLLNIYLSENKFEEATTLLDKMILAFNAYKEDLYPFLAEYPEYLKSKPYQEWINQ
jgi:hypothetical protein